MYDFLFINCHRQHEISTDSFCDWLGIYCLATFLDKNGYPSRAFAGYSHKVEEILEQETEKGIKAVGLSCDYENRQEVFQLCRYIRQKYNLPVIIGGPQSIGLDLDFLLESGCLAIVHGEGELPLLALAQYVFDGYGSLSDILSITYIDNGKPVSNLRCKPITNLDNLPFIDTSLVLNKDFRRRTLTLLTARGCPFRCAFCYEGSNTRGVRWRSVENVMAEIRQAFAEKPNLKYVLFADDTFTLNAGRLKRFIAALKDLRNEKDFIWFAEAHPRTIIMHPELIREMVDAGLANMQIGIESGNPKTLEAYNKKTTPDLVREAVKLCRQAGVPHLTANIITGGAWETEETLRLSREFALELLEIGKGMLDIHPVYFWPLPNTAITLKPEQFGMEIIDKNSFTAVTDYAVVRCGNISPELLSEALTQFQLAVEKRRRELVSELEPAWIKKIMRLAWIYPFTSSWVRDLMKIDRFRRYTSLYHNGAIVSSAQIPTEEIANWHPQRMCPPRHYEGNFFADDLKISRDLFEVFKASAGRMTTAEAAAYCKLSLDDFMTKAKELEENLALGFCKY